MTQQSEEARFIHWRGSFFNVLDPCPQGGFDRPVTLVESFVHEGPLNRKSRVGYMSARSLEAEIAAGRAAPIYLPAADESAPAKICTTGVNASAAPHRDLTAKPTLDQLLRKELLFKASDLGHCRPMSRNARRHDRDEVERIDA